jgi:acetylornithine deacetylase/succinyl-diaminopimelate desuccinylase-like protein
VPKQKPEKIRKLVEKHIRKLAPPRVRVKVTSGHGGDPYLMSPTGPQAQAALRALKKSFGYEPVLVREGGSIPIVNNFKRELGADTLLLGLALRDDNPHSPNEKFDLDCFAGGMRLGAYLWQELGADGTRSTKIH